MQRKAVVSGFEGASPHRGPGLVDTQGVGAVSLKNNADRRATAGRLCFSGEEKGFQATPASARMAFSSSGVFAFSLYFTEAR